MNTSCKLRQTMFKFVAGTIWRYLEILKKEIFYCCLRAVRPRVAPLWLFISRSHLQPRSFSALRNPQGGGNPLDNGNVASNTLHVRH